MRFASLFKKSLIENFRDWKIISLTLSLAPFFVLLMYLYFNNASIQYRIVVVNDDGGALNESGEIFNTGRELVSGLDLLKDEKGEKILRIQLVQEMETALDILSKKSADVVIHIPKTFSQALLDYQKGRDTEAALIKTYGDPGNARYMMAAVWSDMIIYQFAEALSGRKGPIELQQISTGSSRTKSEFELYVPGLLSLSLIMLMFTAAASLIKEKDKGTIIRLRLSTMSSFEWLSAVTLVQVIIGLLAFALTYLTAVGLGYEPSGSITAITVIAFFSSLSIMAISLLVAAFLRTIFDLMTIGCFPFFLLMFFSGAMFPLPKIPLLSIAGHTFSYNDILPITHTIAALEKVMNQNAGLTDISFELLVIGFLTFVFFSLGGFVFSRRHLKPQ